MTSDSRCPIVMLAFLFLIPALVACGVPEATPMPVVTRTPVPTLTPPPTDTPQPIRTPADTRPDVAEKALVILQHASYTDRSGNLHIVGEVYNNTDQNLTGVKIKSLLYDGDENLLGDKETYAYVEILRPEQRAPFALMILNPATAPSTYDLEVNGTEATAEPFLALQVVQHALLDNGDTVSIIGEIRNTSEGPASKIRVSAALYDAAGRILDVGFGYAQLDVLDPGEVSPFEIVAGTANGTPDQYRVAAYGERASEQELSQRADLEILTTHAHRNALGDLTIVGEILNAGDTNVVSAKIVVSLYDEKEQLLAVQWSDAWREIIEEQDRSPFKVRLLSTPDNVDHWTIQVQGSKASDPVEGELTLEEKNNSVDANNISTFTGKVKNNGPETMENIEIAATIYDKEGNVRGVDWVYLDGALAPGASAPFELQVQATQDAQGFRLAVQGKIKE